MKTKIQLITEDTGTLRMPSLTLSHLSSPFALDMYDVNIVDLSSSQIWTNSSLDFNSVDETSDFVSLHSMVQNSKSSAIVFVLPVNHVFQCDYNNYTSTYDNKVFLKDILRNLTANILSVLLPFSICDALIFENSISSINGTRFWSSFAFLPKWCAAKNKAVLTQADGSQKPTTIGDGRFYVTTLQATENEQKIYTFLQALKLTKQSSDNYPQWLLDCDILDDKAQKTLIAQSKAQIKEAEQAIAQAEKKRQENLKYKSILVESGDMLVATVSRIFEKILAVDLSAFVDEKKEDFLFSCGDITFIGEIKGVNSNVKSENVSQLERHFHAYQDKLREEGRKETVKKLLIIAPCRNKPLNQREPVHEIQIDLARSYGSLIITTEILLKIFERFCNHEISTADIKTVFSAEVGLLSMDAFETMKES